MPPPETPKRPVTLPIGEALLAEARALGIDVARAAEAGLERAVAQKRAEAWLKENREALQRAETGNGLAGLPPGKYRH